ncbi:hypothetical protein L227DRAFT_512401 [Lentinus tigrinus ALCF2SS1-6]|uniref:DUF6589 domain-containing protein n=1 Tax=Lentinus tigrinus ALCF2SS1-6 TaxID=1328759 RepID=A0A5C2RUZ1_9APHY|nr:hypothetical protein L227DRAFT_512401 [Lentinus tigrinus ALCF2SS1-6]
MREQAVDRVLAALDGHSICAFLVAFLSNSTYDDHPLRQQFIQELADLLLFFCSLAYLSPTVTSFCLEQVIKVLTSEVRGLVQKETGWHFSAHHAKADSILDFSLSETARKMAAGAPSLWKVLAALLNSDPSHTRRRAQTTKNLGPAPRSGDGVPESDEEDEYWAQVEEWEEAEGTAGVQPEEDGERPSKRQRRAGQRNAALLRIRLVIITSIMMISTNQRCNALASLVGLFCHSTSAPELVIEVLSRTGLSISLTAIHDMITSLSRNSSEAIRWLAKTLLCAFAYDNFDMDFKSSVPTVEKPGSTLQHATSALIFPLEHGVVPADLKFASELWHTDPCNPFLPEDDRPPRRTWVDCMPPPHPGMGPDVQTRILAWHFRHALVTHCEAFTHLRAKLGMPETILQIPVKKTTHIPCRAMDINQSTHDGQAQIIENLLAQAMLGDPSDYPSICDLDDQVLLFHGDLGTGERIQGIRMSRSIEETPSRR